MDNLPLSSASYDKNKLKEEYDIPQDIDLLNKWTILKISPSVIYKYGLFDNIISKYVVKTTEKSISLNSDEHIIQLLDHNDIDSYKSAGKFNFMHIGLVQIAFKPLTLKGLPESFIAAVRDARNLDWKKILNGYYTIQSGQWSSLF
ncbi:hypothetical protein ACH5RR_030361 [Cinchona calisaya]|uniref:Uncharacterized protein n=1 Tax=Cinchona calisaya TaxID=153742 RepID=A0ABD2YXV2_9GENT